jgi:hypothetical protein
MITTQTIVSAFINSKHGWAVAKQFEATFDGGEPFEEQNYNALLYIRDAVNNIINSDVLSNESEAALGEYMDELEDYIVDEGR